MRTFFQDFVRDNGLPVTVEYSATGGEPDFDFPGHICDGGGSGPEIAILKAWPNTDGHERLARLSMWCWHRRNAWHGLIVAALKPAVHLAIRIDEWWRASLTTAEYERFEAWLAEHYVEEPFEPDFDR